MQSVTKVLYKKKVLHMEKFSTQLYLEGKFIKVVLVKLNTVCCFAWIYWKTNNPRFSSILEGRGVPGIKISSIPD